MEDQAEYGNSHSIKAGNTDVKIVLKPGATMPRYETQGSAGMDLFAHLGPDNAKILVKAGAWMPVMVPTGIKIQMQEGIEGMIRGRSGFMLKGLEVHKGTIDSDFIGEVQVIVYNVGPQDIYIEHGMKFAQIVFSEYKRATLTQVDQLTATERGEKGFGSSGYEKQ